MNEQIFLQGTTPEALIEKINESVKLQLEDFKKNLNTTDPDALLSRAEACKFLKIEQTTLYHWQKAGKIKMYGCGNRRYLKKAELIECLILKK
jgi:excisionase family DNA binding protein